MSDLVAKLRAMAAGGAENEYDEVEVRPAMAPGGDDYEEDYRPFLAPKGDLASFSVPLATKLRAMAANGATPRFSVLGTGPGPSADLTRILALPRRVLEPTEALADKWTERLKRPGGTMRLKPIQAAALDEAFRYGGILGLLGVGSGKTIISLLCFTVWGSRNGALLIPPNLKTKLFDLEYPELAKHWRIPNLVGHRLQYPDTKEQFHAVTYSQLSSAKHADILASLGVDDLSLDEVHAVRHSSAARSKRFKRFARTQRPQPAPVVSFGDDRGRSSDLFRRRIAGLSGSITSGSVIDYDHLSALILGDGSPLPLDWNTQREWSYSLDAGDTPAPAGALEALGPGSVREAFRKRLVETPGVVATTTNDPGMSLIYSRIPLKAPKVVLDALQKVRDTWLRPDGFPLREAIEVYALQRQLACGFYYRRIYPNGEPKALIEEWVAAKKDYDSDVRDRLKLSIQGQDSPLLCWNAAKAGKWKCETWARWAAVRAAVKPDKETVWLDRFLVDAAVEWATAKPGIVWVEAEATRAAFDIAEAAGIPVYAGGAEDEAALIREDGSRSIVASIRAFNAGVNLQAFGRSLITTCPASNALLEQVIGRTHRPGQLRDEVTVDFYLHVPELVDSLQKAIVKAKYVEESTANSQKLRIGTFTFAV